MNHLTTHLYEQDGAVTTNGPEGPQSLTGLVGKLAPSSLRWSRRSLCLVQLLPGVPERSHQAPVFGFFGVGDGNAYGSRLRQREARSDSSHLRFPLSDRSTDRSIISPLSNGRRGR